MHKSALKSWQKQKFECPCVKEVQGNVFEEGGQIFKELTKKFFSTIIPVFFSSVPDSFSGAESKKKRYMCAGICVTVTVLLLGKR